MYYITSRVTLHLDTRNTLQNSSKLCVPIRLLELTVSEHVGWLSPSNGHRNWSDLWSLTSTWSTRMCVCVALLTSTMRIYFQTIYGQSRVVFKTCPEKWSREVHLGDFNLVLVKIFDLHIMYSSGNRMEVTYFEIAVV